VYTTYLRRELLRRKRAAILVATGLALGITLVILVSSVSAGMAQAQRDVLQSLYGLGTDLTVTAASPAGEQDGGEGFEFDGDGGATTQGADRVVVRGATLDTSTVGTVAGQPGVAGATGALSLQVLRVSGQFSQGTITEDAGGEAQEGAHAPRSQVEGGGARFNVNNFSVYGVDPARTGLGPLASLTISSGTGLSGVAPDAPVAVLDSAYASQARLAVGDTLAVNGMSFRITGLASPASGNSVANVYVPLAAAQALAQAPGKVSTVYVQATDSTRIGAVKSEVQQTVPAATVTTSADLAQTVSGSLSTAASLVSRVGRWLSVAVLAAAFLVAALLTSAAVTRRVREFGTLKALGWSSGRVTRQVMGESLVNGLVGGALGIGLGLAAAYAVSSSAPVLTAQLGRGGGGERFGEAAEGTLQVTLGAPVTGATIALAVALAVAGGLVAGAYGGWRASRLRPADALRRIE